MLIRKMTLEDVDAVVQIEQECFSLPWSEKSFVDSISREDTIFLVCEEASVITGYMGLYISFDEASVTNVAVSPNFRKRGYGEQLVATAKEVAKDAGAESIFLEVRVSNVPAISLYKKLGFEELGIRKKFYEHPVEDAIIMKVGI
ncbi:MAG: ribosomal protein S18-alanine N-acetyltransferase [Agathobacter sp.]|nr:ribosomal protein S18-alanine N-acetyltransferase [Agathobacter sp.]